jgi:hypothetical protein
MYDPPDQGTDAALRLALQNASEQEAFELILEELERFIWQYTLWPASLRWQTRTPRIPQAGVVIEIIPNVFAHAIHMMDGDTPHHFIRLWGNVRLPNGVIEERTFFCAKSDNFPDESVMEMRPGMVKNYAWWFDIRDYLIGAISGRSSQQLPGGAQLHADGNFFAAEAPSHWPRRAPWNAAQSDPVNAFISGVANGAAGGSATAERELAELRRSTSATFDEWKTRREAAYTERDALDRRLLEVYFQVFPFMRAAASHTSALAIEKALTAWVEKGCPAPSSASQVELPPGVSPDLLLPDPNYARKLEELITEARHLSDELVRVRLQAQERALALERLCELSGGHVPRTQRDSETAAPRLICDRCGASLHARPPEQSDAFLR